MALLGLLLMLIAGGLTAGVLLSHSYKLSPAPEVFGVSLGDVSTTGLFLAGLATALVFALGLSMLLAALRRARRRRLERREIVRDSRDQQASLAAEKNRLERELQQERGQRANAATVTERTVVEREPIGGERSRSGRGGDEGSREVADGNDAGGDRPGLFRR